MRAVFVGVAAGILGVTCCLGCVALVCRTAGGNNEAASSSEGYAATTDDSGRSYRGIRRLPNKQVTEALYDDALYAVNYENTPLSEVVRDFDFCAVHCLFLYGDKGEYTGTVSIVMNGVTWSDALDEILADHGLELDRNDVGPPVYRIRKRKRSTPRPSQSGTAGWYSTNTNRPSEALQNRGREDRAAMNDKLSASNTLGTGNRY